MKGIRGWWDLACAAGRIGFSDLASIFSLRAWLFGWFGRLVTQVIFFSMFGLLLGSVSETRYRVVGNSAALACIEAMAVIMAVVRERNEGTITLQVISPAPFTWTYIARGACNFIVGIGSSAAAFVITAAVFQVPVEMWKGLLTPLALAVMAVTSYCFGLAIGALVMAKPGFQWLAINCGYLSVMTFSGVNVPTSYWPAPIRVIAQGLPLTHGLLGWRLLLSGGSFRSAAGDIAVELCLGLCWLAVAVVLLQRSVFLGRRQGTLEISAN
jgi:ABC-2 type transport system permease protein